MSDIEKRANEAAEKISKNLEGLAKNQSDAAISKAVLAAVEQTGNVSLELIFARLQKMRAGSANPLAHVQYTEAERLLQEAKTKSQS